MIGAQGAGQPRYRSRARLLAAGLGITLAMGLAACGGDDEGSEETTAEATTKVEFVAEADAICTESASLMRAQFNDAFANIPPDPADVLTLFRNLSPIVHGALDDIAEVPPPPGDEGEVAAMLEVGNEEADRLDTAVADPAVLRQALADGIFPQVYDAFVAYGLKRCASVTSPDNALR